MFVSPFSITLLLLFIQSIQPLPSATEIAEIATKTEHNLTERATVRTSAAVEDEVTTEVVTREQLISSETLSKEASRNELEGVQQSTTTSSEPTEAVNSDKHLTNLSTEQKSSSNENDDGGEDKITTASLAAEVATASIFNSDGSSPIDQDELLTTPEENDISTSSEPIEATGEVNSSMVKEESAGLTAPAKEQPFSTPKKTATVEPTEGSFTFIVPDFHAHKSSNSSTEHHSFNDTEWAAMIASASIEDADEMFDDPCSYLSHRIDHLLGLNISKQAIQQFIVDLNISKFEEEQLPALKKSLEDCVELHEKDDGDVDEAGLPPICRDLHQTIGNVCKFNRSCDFEDTMVSAMVHIKHLLTTDTLHDALVMVRACADQTYHEKAENQE